MSSRSFASRLRLSAAVVAVTALASCALFGGSGGSDSTAPGSDASGEPLVSQEQKDIVRQAERQAFSQSTAQLDQPEADAKKALELMLGTVPAYQGGQNPYPAAEAIAELRKAKITLSLEPVLGTDGKPVATGFVTLEDSYTTRVKELSRKMAEGKASKREMKEIQDGAKHVVKLNDVRAQVTAASLPAMGSGWLVTSTALQTMLRASSMVRSRRQQEMEWIAEDYELVRMALAEQRRAETIAAIAQGTLAAYQAVMEGVEPSMLTEFGTETLKAFPITLEVTAEEAQQYIEALDQNIASTKDKYESQMRQTYGDAVYEQQYKANIDAMFAQAEGALSAQSATERSAAINEQYQADVVKCFKGEPVDPGSMAGGPTCDDYARCGRGEAPNGPAVTPQKCAEAAQWAGAGAVAEAGAKAGANAALDAAKNKAMSFIPADGPIGAALTGVRALRNRDFGGAVNAALEFVPAGPAKMGLKLVANFIGKLGDLNNKRKKRKKK